MLRTVIVEDESLAANLLKKMLAEHCPYIQLVGICKEVNEAIQVINKEQPDLVFMDIELQTGTGFDILLGVNDRKFKCIFTTAYDHYAIKAIKFSAVDYLLKPIDVLELKEAVNKIRDSASVGTRDTLLDQLLKNINKKDDLSISLSTQDGIEFVAIKDILFLEANGAYTFFHIKNKPKLLISKNLKEFELLLSEHGFFRINNSHIINIAEIKGMNKSEGGFTILSNNAQIAISPKKKEEFIQLLSNRLVK